MSGPLLTAAEVREAARGLCSRLEDDFTYTDFVEHCRRLADRLGRPVGAVVAERLLSGVSQYDLLRMYPSFLLDVGAAATAPRA